MGGSGGRRGARVMGGGMVVGGGGGGFQCKMIEWLNIVAGKQTQRSFLSQRRKQTIVLTSVFKRTRQ